MYDCNKMKYKVLSIIEYKTNMGRGRNFRYAKNVSNESSDTNWIYPSIDSKDFIKISSICSHKNMAEREGFEPSKQFPVYTLSKRAPSATRPPLH